MTSLRQSAKPPLKLPILNATQKSLLVPTGATYLLGGAFGFGGVALGWLGGMVATPVIYWKLSTAEQPKWRKALTAVGLTCGSSLLTIISGGIGVETMLRTLRPAAYEQAQREAKNSAQETAKVTPPQSSSQDWRTKVSQGEVSTQAATTETAKPAELPQRFSATKYFADSGPEVTNGTAVLNAQDGTTEWYNEVKSGGYAGYKYNFKCNKSGAYSEMDEYSGGVWKISSDAKCSVISSKDGTPREFKVIDSDGFVSQSVQITADNTTSPTATAVRKLPDQTTVTVQCKEKAKAASATGKINWNAFGTGDPRWYAPAATVILSGKTKNAFGTMIPFKIECRGDSDGSVKVVEVTK